MITIMAFWNSQSGSLRIITGRRETIFETTVGTIEEAKEMSMKCITLVKDKFPNGLSYGFFIEGTEECQKK
jgi:hypothetical protein